MKKKWISILLVFAMLCTGLVGCTGEGTQENKGSNGSNSGKGKPTEVTVWTSYGSEATAMVNELAIKFNQSQTEYEVSLEISGTVDQIRSKLANSRQKYYPSIFFGANNAIYEYAAADYVVPIQEFIDKDSDKWADDIFDNVRISYSDAEGNMIGSPLGVSAKGYMVNMELLEQAGYKLEDITSFEKVAEIATAAHDKGLCKYGYVVNDGTDLLNMLVYQGVDVLDADNGYSGTVEKCLFTEGDTNAALKKAVKIMADMYANGVAFPNFDGAGGGMSTFFNRQVVFWSCTNSKVWQLLRVNLGFEWAFIPAVGVDDAAEYKGYALSEGTGMFIANTGDEKEMQGAYEFIKFMTKAENQVQWGTETGYVPFTNEAAANEDWITWKNENFTSADALIAKMQAAPDDLKFPYCKVSGQIISGFREIISDITNDPKGDLDAYIEEEAEDLDQSIEYINKRGTK